MQTDFHDANWTAPCLQKHLANRVNEAEFMRQEAEAIPISPEAGLAHCTADVRRWIPEEMPSKDSLPE